MIKRIALITIFLALLLQTEPAGATGRDLMLILKNRGLFCAIKGILCSTKRGLATRCLRHNKKSIFKAIAKNNFAGVKKELIKHPDDINLKNYKQETPLGMAARKGNLRIIKHLIEKGAEINVVGKKQRTPLIHAIRKDHFEVAPYLIHNNVNRADCFNSTPLYYAILSTRILLYAFDNPLFDNDKVKDKKSQAFHLIRYLIAAGADIDTTDCSKQTSLHLAAKHGSLESVKYFIEKGAKPHAQDENGETALQLASKKNHVPIVRYLELADAVYKTIKDPTEFEIFAKNHLEVTNENIVDVIAIASASNAKPDLEFLKKLFFWMRCHKAFLLEQNLDEYEPFDAKWFYLDLATQAKNDHVKIAWLERCFNLLEKTNRSAFDREVNCLILCTQAQILLNNLEEKRLVQKKDLVGSLNETEQKRLDTLMNNRRDLNVWDKTCKKKNIVLQRENAYTLCALTKIPKLVTTAGKRGFRDVYVYVGLK